MKMTDCRLVADLLEAQAGHSFIAIVRFISSFRFPTCKRRHSSCLTICSRARCCAVLAHKVTQGACMANMHAGIHSSLQYFAQHCAGRGDQAKIDSSPANVSDALGARACTPAGWPAGWLSSLSTENSLNRASISSSTKGHAVLPQRCAHSRFESICTTCNKHVLRIP